MKKSFFITVSRWIYARLIRFYPAGHRAEYGKEMLLVFTDQVRSEIQSGKVFGLAVFWAWMLKDLFFNVVKEHLSAPNAREGLLEAVPHKPLPWKGVALVVIPGLAFFISQIAQINGEDWFFLMVYRGAYFLIIPVLVVWVWNNKFPIWGLIPLGLLFKTVLAYAMRMQVMAYDRSSPIFQWVISVLSNVPVYILIIVYVIFYASILFMLLSLVRSWIGIQKRAWIWAGIYLIFLSINYFAFYRDFQMRVEILDFPPVEFKIYLLEIAYTSLFTYVGFLVLIVLGAWLSKKHGRLAILLPIGYLIPTIIYGRISNDWPDPGTSQYTFMLSVCITALVYRFLVSIVAPVWIVRSATEEKQKNAGAVSFFILIGIQVGFNLISLYSADWNFNQINTLFLIVSDQLLTGVGIGLALALFKKTPVEAEMRWKTIFQ